MLRSTEKSGGRGNPFSAVGANAFHTSNFRSRSAMRGAKTGIRAVTVQPAYSVYYIVILEISKDIFPKSKSFLSELDVSAKSMMYL